jgi:hypothetical protein
MPRIRAAGAVISLAMLLSLVLMNYHFVGDLIAGGFLGGIIAAYAVHLAKLKLHLRKSIFKISDVRQGDVVGISGFRGEARGLVTELKRLMRILR